MYVDSTVDTYLNNFLLMFLMSWSYFNHSYCVFSLFNLKWNNTGPYRLCFCCSYFLILYNTSLHLIIIFFIHSSGWLRPTLFSFCKVFSRWERTSWKWFEPEDALQHVRHRMKFFFRMFVDFLLLHLLIYLCYLEKYTGHVNEGPVRIQ